MQASLYPTDYVDNTDFYLGTTASGTVKRFAAKPVREYVGSSAIYYVATTGNDSTGDGTVGNPWLTGTRALYVITQSYDFGQQEPIIQFQDGTYNFTGDTEAYVQWSLVGGSANSIRLRGNLANASAVIFDGGSSGTGVYLSRESLMTMFVGGMTFSNCSVGINNQSKSGTIFIDGPVKFTGGNDRCMNCESGGAIISGGTTITISGTNAQLIYCSAMSHFDFNDTQFVFSGTPAFSYALYNIDSGANGQIYDHFTGSATGTKFYINGGATLRFTDAGGAFINPSGMPGNAAGSINGGWLNNYHGTELVAVSALSTAVSAGARAIVNNATVTTYNSVVAGGGANKVPVFYDGTNWRIG